MDDIFRMAEEVSLFCRLNINTKKQLPIRSSEMGLLIYLSKHDGQKTPQAASIFFKVSKAMITNMVTSLTKHGYIIKEPCEHDRRSILLIPTEKALHLVEETFDEYFKMMSILKTKMNASDFSNFIRLLKEANNILSEVKNNG